MYIEFIEVFKMLLSGALGYIVGIEREKIGKPTGKRTLALVSMASAFIVMIGIRLYPDDSAEF